ncbi:hypothetical protein Ddye_023468 [Dipteronia dyeriana]|uniref:Ubiquitin-like protease family profile domain-containing protein n=1 Tax=Dipteronia dyeriana TaxID=168575 RepID=A0AAD9TSY5_9ROSI|nr:hypothetical protein Ddye_023468 [Dipteronia dyeriana]
MVENVDQAENVSVAEAKNLPESGNVAQTENVTQNKNVVETEEPSQNEDLDQFFLHPRNTWAYDITIIVHCKLKLIHHIKEVLADCGELEDFKKSRYRHYLDLPHYMRGLFQAQYIHNLLLLQIRFLGANDNEMWFAIGNTKVLVPYNVGDNHWVFCVVRLHDWIISIYDSATDKLPDNPKHKESQVLPRRHLSPLICNVSGDYEVSKQPAQKLTCMKAMSLAPTLFLCQEDGDSCGVFMLKSLEYVKMNKDPNFNFNQDNIFGFRKQMARDIFANSLPCD